MKTRSFLKVYRYVSGEFLLSTFTAFLFFFGVFFINQLLLLAEEILAKRVPFLDVARLILYSLPAILAFSAPFSALVGCLMAMGKFASSNEIIAFKASGISQSRLFLPVFIVGVFLSVGSFFVNDFLLPWGTLNFTRLYRQLLVTHPELELESHSIKNFQDTILATGEVTPDFIQQILILDRDPDGAKRIITAELGRLDKSVEGVVKLVLEGVTLLSVGGRERDRYSYSFAERMSYSILLRHVSVTFRGVGPREMSSYDVYKEIQKKTDALNKRIQENNNRIVSLRQRYRQRYYDGIDAVLSEPHQFVSTRENLQNLLYQLRQEEAVSITDRSLQLYLIEFYKKFSIPAGSLFFIFFAFPTALFTKRSGKIVGFGVGLLISIFYWGMLVAGQTLGVRANFSPFLAMWLPNFIILILGAISFTWERVR